MRISAKKVNDKTACAKFRRGGERFACHICDEPSHLSGLFFHKGRQKYPHKIMGVFLACRKRSRSVDLFQFKNAINAFNKLRLYNLI